MIKLQTLGGVPCLTAQNIAPSHCFTTRLGGVSTGVDASMNIALNSRDSLGNVEKNIHILGSALGFDPEKLVLTRQTHSDIVRVVGAGDHISLCHRDYPECDALVTDCPGVSLLVFSADCTPLLFWDSRTGAVGAAHAGWRGTAKAIGRRVVETMAAAFGSRPEDIHAAIGPNIGACHFETDADVVEALTCQYGEEVLEFVEKRGEKFFPDLKAVNALALRRAGLRNIEISEHCTVCQGELFWSHRASGGLRGSQGAVICCGEVAK